jgi:hypothetical protein
MPARDPSPPRSSSSASPDVPPAALPATRALGVRGVAAVGVAAAGGALVQWAVTGAVGVPWAAAACALAAGALAAAAHRHVFARHVAGPFAALADRLRAEQAHRARAEKLATVGRMAAGIAHEVGNPLAAIGSYAHLVRLRTDGVAGVTPALDGLEREADRIDRIVRGLLDYARPRRATPSPVSVNELAAGAVRLLQEQGVLRKLDVRLELDPRAPAVFVERQELEQVFVNLLLNAADAIGGPGRVTVLTRQTTVGALCAPHERRSDDAPGVYRPHRPNRRVTEWLTGARPAPEDVVQVVVADSGPGVPPEDAERIFDPFFTTKVPGKGTGLGLAIVARTVDDLGGAVWVQRAREGGAAFVLVLPVSARSAALPAVDAAAAPIRP